MVKSFLIYSQFVHGYMERTGFIEVSKNLIRFKNNYIGHSS